MNKENFLFKWLFLTIAISVCVIFLAIFLLFLLTDLVNIAKVVTLPHQYVYLVPITFGFVGIVISLFLAYFLAQGQMKRNVLEFLPKGPIYFFRSLIVLDILLSLLASYCFVFWKPGWSAQAQHYLDWQLLQVPSFFQVTANIIFIISLMVFTVSTLGVFLFSRKARYFYVASIVIYYVFGFSDGAYIRTGVSIIFSTLDHIIIGMIIVLMFTDPIKKYFSK